MVLTGMRSNFADCIKHMLVLPKGVSAAGKQQGLLDPRSNLVVEGFNVFDRMPSGSDPQDFALVCHLFRRLRCVVSKSDCVTFRAVCFGHFFETCLKICRNRVKRFNMSSRHQCLLLFKVACMAAVHTEQLISRASPLERSRWGASSGTAGAIAFQSQGPNH